MADVPRVIDGWREPESLGDARAIRLEVADAVQSIQTQLGRSDPADDDDLMAGWRIRAKDALRHKVSELRRLNVWIKQEGIRLHEQEKVQNARVAGASPDDIDSVLLAGIRGLVAMGHASNWSARVWTPQIEATKSLLEQARRIHNGCNSVGKRQP